MSESTDYARKELERIGAFTEDGDFYGGVPSEVMEAFANIRRKTLPCVCGKWTPVGHHGVCVAGDLATIEAAYRRLDLALSENYARFAAMQAELTALLQKGYGDLPKLRQQRDDYGDALAKAEARLAALHVVLRAVAEATYLVRLAKDAHAWGRISFDELCIYEDDAVSILDAWKAGQR